jgi:tetratricopeptide (TPR) repeat protein
MTRMLRIVVVGLALCAATAFAQEAWQGKGRMGGKVVDPAGKPIEGVKIKLVNLTTKTGPELVTTKKGEWKIDNVAYGMWYVEYYKDGFDPLRKQVEVGEKLKTQNLDLKLTTEGTDPNLAINLCIEKAKQLIDAQKFAEARTGYLQVLAKYPQVVGLHKLIAVTYHMEKNYAKAADELQAYVTASPTDNEAKLYFGKELIAADRIADAWQVYSTIDPAAIKDFLDLEDPGFDLMRAKKPVEALKYFDLVVTRFPQEPTGFYYRGFAGWHSMLTITKVDDPARIAYRDKARADIEKFLEMAPESKEAATAKQILAELKK